MAKFTMNGGPDVADDMMKRLLAADIPASCRTGDCFIDFEFEDKFSTRVRQLFAREMQQN